MGRASPSEEVAEVTVCAASAVVSCAALFAIPTRSPRYKIVSRGQKRKSTAVYRARARSEEPRIADRNDPSPGAEQRALSTVECRPDQLWLRGRDRSEPAHSVGPGRFHSTGGRSLENCVLARSTATVRCGSLRDLRAR